MRVAVITGAAQGIGRQIAETLAARGYALALNDLRPPDDTVAALGSRRDVAEVFVGDVSDDDFVARFAEGVLARFGGVDVLVNNAGIQRRVSLLDDEPWEKTHDEIAINVEAPIHLSRLFIPHFRRQPRAAIVNVTSGLSFAPLANVPIYCATKAALHSFTLSLRHQLRDTAIEVVEIVPPAVDTDLGGPGLHTFGVDVNEFADAVMARVAAGEQEVGYGFAEQSRQASREQLDAMFERMNASRP